jgi:type II secretory pathway pseudopilin PulG
MNRRIFTTGRSIDYPQCSARSGNRVAVSLIELLVVISLLSVAMAAMGALLHGVWRVQSAMDDHQLSMSAFQRLAAQFRSDVHCATTASVGQAPASDSSTNPPATTVSSESDASLRKTPAALQSFTLMLPDAKQVEYQMASDRDAINRTVRNGGEVVAREEYVLPAGATVQWKIVSSDPARQQSPWEASLQVSYPLSNHLPEVSERRELRIDAVAGVQNSEIRIEKGNRQ